MENKKRLRKTASRSNFVRGTVPVDVENPGVSESVLRINAFKIRKVFTRSLIVETNQKFRVQTNFLGPLVKKQK